MKSIKSLLFGALLGAMALNLSSCGGGGGGGSTWGSYSSPYVSAQSFVNGLNNADFAPSYDESFIILNTDETVRSAYIGEDDWFVIYDAKYDEYKAVSLQYIRSIVYYDYYSNSTGLAEEFRDIETDDIFAGYVNGDAFGDDYEVVDYDSWTGTYVGRESGWDYEDEEGTTDVLLMAAEKQKKAFIKKAAAVSYAYNVGIETSLSLVSLGYKVEKAISKGKGELTADDQAAVLGDLEKLTGKTFTEILEASTDADKKAAMVKDIASKIGTTAQNLEDRILPELFNVK
ncbi:MAG: hypothetical protein CME70_05245 [Halobacteriovorax sp.]|nr:hypothetical protein [Halobacteriovorax sp.]|tara:strand:+ start:4289 stop:5149 length:861 start_codon:yes stop_codon:yes gene_type:complete